MIEEIEKAVKELRGAILATNTEGAAQDLHDTISMLRDLALAKVRCFGTQRQHGANLKRAVDTINEARNSLDVVLGQ